MNRIIYNLLSMLLLGLAVQVSAASIVVSDIGDTGANTLRDAISTAQSGDTIRFDSEINGDTIKLTSGQLTLDKDIYIYGNDTSNTIIDGQQNGRVFEISEGITVLIYGVKIQNGSAAGFVTPDDSGGGILNRGVLTLELTKVSMNIASNVGGGINCTEQGTLRCINTEISKNSANEGAGVYNNYGSLNFTNSLISGNIATGNGGGILNNASAVLFNCNISGNTAYDGGGLYNQFGEATIAETTVTGNTASNGGGGIYNLFGILSIVNAMISFNHAMNGAGVNNFSTATFFNSVISQNISSVDGGGIYNQSSGDVETLDSKIWGNSAVDGAGIYNGSLAEITTTNVYSNIASNSGGGILNANIVTIMNCSISGNTADIGGGISNDEEGASTVINTVVSGNVASLGGAGICNFGETHITSCTISGNSTPMKGGGINNKVGIVSLNSSMVSGNSDLGFGPDLFGDTTLYTDEGYNFIGIGKGQSEIVNGTNGNQVGTESIPIDPLFVLDVPLSTPNTEGDLRLNCSSSAIDTAEASFDVDIGETDLAGQPRYVNKLDIGAYERHAFPGITIVFSNQDSGVGTLRNAVDLTCMGDTIMFSSSLDGDAIKLISGQILLDKNLVIIGNDASKTIVDGQQIDRIFEITGGSIILDGLRLQNGLASGPNAKDKRGGAIYNASILELRNTIISGNTATTDGGGIYTPMTLVSRNSILSGNKAGEAGGGLTNVGSAMIINSTISGNSAGTSGGGVKNDGAFEITNSIVARNLDDGSGPDIYSSLSANIIDEGNNLIGDTTSVDNDFTTSTLLGTTAVPLDPQFVVNVPSTTPTSVGDLRLMCGSIAIDNGKDTMGLDLGHDDLANAPRLVNGVVDIGAYERHAFPGTIMVTNSRDLEEVGSLRNAIALACSGDTIRFDASMDGLSLDLISGPIILDKSLTIMGNNADKTIIDGQDLDRIFHVNAGVTVHIDGLTIRNGKVDDSTTPQSGKGGGVYNEGTLTLSNSVISGNAAFSSSSVASGGGIYNASDLTLINVTISGNSAISTSSKGGGVNNGGTMFITNSIIALNADSGLGADIFSAGSFTDGGYNLLGNGLGQTSIIHNNQSNLVGASGSGIDPIFEINTPNTGVGASSGGDLRLQCGSPAIDNGDDSANALILERLDASKGKHLDIGAFEKDAVCHEIAVTYKSGITILDGDLNADINDGTDFGESCNSQIDSFYIRNIGQHYIVLDTISLIELTQGGIIFNGDDFNFPDTIACGDSLLLEIAFQTSLSGKDSVIVNIVSNDNDEGLYDFKVIGSLDNTNPIAVCRDTSIYTNASGVFQIDSSFIDNGSSDACGIKSMSLDIENFNCNSSSQTTVTLTVTDLSGSFETCTSIVTVLDTISPTASCKSINVFLSSAGTVSIIPQSLNNNSADACGLKSFGTDILSLSCADVGMKNVILSVTDNNDNIKTCTSVVTVLDTISPVANCKSINVYLNANGAGSIIPIEVNNNSNDACNIKSFSANILNFSCGDIGTNNVILTVVDDNDNATQCTSVVTVIDTISPTAQCKNINAFLNSGGTTSITPVDLNNNSSDACGNNSYAASSINFNCQNIGNNNIVLSVTDGNGNIGMCTSIVTIIDTISPIANCKNIDLYLSEIGTAIITSQSINNDSNDACGGISLSATPLAFTCSETGTNNVVLTVTDDENNVKTCTSIVTVIDTISPSARCKNVSLYLNSLGTGSITPQLINNVSTDACMINSISANLVDFYCDDVGENNVILSVMDDSNNLSTCSSTVTVIDTISPTANCNNTVLYLSDTGIGSISAASLSDNSVDACSIISYNASTLNFTCTAIGENDIILTIIDVNGNISTCTSVVTVLDTISPSATCRNIDVYLASNGLSTITAPEINNGSIDACGIQSMSSDILDFDCGDIGQNNVTLTVKDDYDNISNCQSLVTVIDSIKPVAKCQNIEITLDAINQSTVSVDQINNASTDNCSLKSLNLSKDDFSISDLGDNMISMTVTDEADLSTVCNALVTVLPFPGSTHEIIGSGAFCPAISGMLYSVPVEFNVDSFNWSYSGSGVNISEDGARIIIDFTPTATAGTLSVQLLSATDSILGYSQLSLSKASEGSCDMASCLNSNIDIDAALLDAISPLQILRAGQDITINTIIQGFLELRAGQGIVMLPGYAVDQGDIFIGIIEQCQLSIRTRTHIEDSR
ncbi:MAG: putative outer membrane repeat protein [Saprospiraceae bacterium]|jgi:predicted outer membrane repeat protein